MGLDDQQRPFVPLRMRQADRRGDPDARAAGGDVFQIDGADPFAAGLDEVFLAVGEAQKPVFVERCDRSEEHTSELQSLMRISYAVFCLKKTKNDIIKHKTLCDRIY